MASEDRVRVVRAADRVAPAATTPGMLREEAVARDGLWIGTLRTEPGVVTGWHHHGDHESFIYVVSGRIRLEFGPGGMDAEEGGPDDLVVIPPRAVHREGSEAGSEGVGALVIRVGRGAVVVNVASPEPG
jgi:uncharacterized RmlC-like cupin family protein